MQLTTRLLRTYFTVSLIGEGDLLVTGRQGHTAVLAYDAHSESFPRLIARGSGAAGHWIRKAALASGMPQVPWHGLSESLGEHGKIGGRIVPILWPWVARAYARALPGASDRDKCRWRLRGSGRRTTRLLMKRWMMRAVPGADFLLEGVDGRLQAFLYDPAREDMVAPVLLCETTGEHSRLMEALAEEHGIPVVRGDVFRASQIRASSEPLDYAQSDCWTELIDVMQELYHEHPDRFRKWKEGPCRCGEGEKEP